MLKCSEETGIEITGESLNQVLGDFTALTVGFIASLVASGGHTASEAEITVRFAFENGVKGAKRMIDDGAHLKLVEPAKIKRVTCISKNELKTIGEKDEYSDPNWKNN